MLFSHNLLFAVMKLIKSHYKFALQDNDIQLSTQYQHFRLKNITTKRKVNVNHSLLSFHFMEHHSCHMWFEFALNTNNIKLVTTHVTANKKRSTRTTWIKFLILPTIQMVFSPFQLRLLNVKMVPFHFLLRLLHVKMIIFFIFAVVPLKAVFFFNTLNISCEDDTFSLALFCYVNVTFLSCDVVISCKSGGFSYDISYVIVI